MQHSRMDQKIKNVLFEPRLTQTSENSERLRETISSTPLGVVLDHLQTATTLIRSELPSIDLLIQKSVTVKDMGSAELKEVIFKFTFCKSKSSKVQIKKCLILY